MRYLIIPSCEVAPIDRLAGTNTEKRLSRAITLWNSGEYDSIIVTGGIYLPPEIQTTPSGVLMRSWLLARGVCSDNILYEDQSRDTYENISGALALVTNDAAPRFTVVTHWQQALRFWVTFHLAHKRKINLVPVWYRVDFKVFLFEWLSLFVHLIDHRGSGRIAVSNRKARTYSSSPPSRR